MTEVLRFAPQLAPAARAFFERIPEGDRTFFKEDVLDADAITSWAGDQSNQRLVAVEDDGTVVGYVAIIPASVGRATSASCVS